MPQQSTLIKTISQLVKAGKYKQARQAYANDFNDNGKQADEVLNKLLELCNKWFTDNEDAYLFGLQGLIYHDIEEYNKAVESYNKAIELKPDYAKFYYNRGNAYVNFKRYEKACSDYTTAIELKPDYFKAYNNRGVAFHELDKYMEAIQDYAKVIELKPDGVFAYNNRGNVYYVLEKYDKAIRDCNKAIELKSDYDAAYNNRGLAYMKLGKYDLAIQDFTQSIEINTNQTFVYLNRAESYEALEKYGKAIADYSTFIDKTDNTYWKGQAKSEIERLQEILEASGQYLKQIEKAIETIQKELTYNGETITHYTNIGGAKALLLNQESLFRLSEARYMNDPSEGQQLNKALGNIKSIAKDKASYIFKPFLGSFVGDNMHDYLNLWRTYANTNGNDGCGCAITLNRKEFLNTIQQFITSSPKNKAEKQEQKEETLQTTNLSTKKDDFECYKVAYLDENNECINKNSVKAKVIDKAIKKIKEALTILNEKAPRKLTSAYERLSSIAYLFKNEAYQYEEEVRIIIKDAANNEHIVVDTADHYPIPRVYHNIGNIHSALKSVTIGPKVERPDEWETAFTYSFKQNSSIKNQVKISISDLPYK